MKHKHLTQDERRLIETRLGESASFKAIGRELSRDCTTVAKEVKAHTVFRQTGAYGRSFNDCAVRMGCGARLVCGGDPVCAGKLCSPCGKCIRRCSDYIKETCPKPKSPPYVCNGCADVRRCTLEKAFYRAREAHSEYEAVRSESRSGINADEAEIARLDALISPLLKKGQSLNHIFASHHDEIMLSEKTVYNYVNMGLFSAGNLDLPRKVRYRKRRAKKPFKVEKSCRINRTYADFTQFMGENPDTPVTEMDTVEGRKGGKVLLTIHFTESKLMLAFIRDANTARSVADIFETLYRMLGYAAFRSLLGMLLTDNGSEFSNPTALEFDRDGRRRAQVFYCDPQASFQKGACENNHELLRRVIPKGASLDGFIQADISLMMDHINSYSRKALNGRTPYESFRFMHGTEILEKLGVHFVPPDEVVLKPSLLKNRRKRQ